MAGPGLGGLRELSQEDKEIRETVRLLRVECEDRDGWMAVRE